MADKENTASWSELLSGRNGLRTIALAGGVALHAINVYIVATILPSVVQDIGGLAYYAWNMTLFVMASIFSSALSPKLLDRFGPRRAFQLAILAFTLGTALCASAPSMAFMLAGRTLQGFGGGLLLGLSYSSIRLVFAERLWPKSMALLSSMWGVATLSGPALGGMFAEAGHWRWSFWSVVVVAALLALLVQSQIALKTSQPKTEAVRVPLTQIGLMLVSVLFISVAGLQSSVFWNLLGVLLGLLTIIVMARLDQRSATRLMPNGSYRLAGLGSLYACVALMGAAITVEIFVPYFLQGLQGHSPLVAGYMGALMSAGWTIGSVTSSSRSEATAGHYMNAGPVICALGLMGLGMVFFVSQPDQLTPAVFWLTFPALLAIGLGIGVCWPHLLTQVFKIAPAGQENMASSAIITVQLYAMALGAAIGGMVTNAAGFTNPGGLEGTRHAALALLWVFALAPGAAIFFMTRTVRSRVRLDT